MYAGNYCNTIFKRIFSHEVYHIEFILSGTMIRGTLTRESNLPRDAKHVLSDRAHEGLQSSSDPKERKGLKEAHFALGPRPSSNSTAHSHPPKTRGAISASLEVSLPRPSTAPRTSVLLEGNEPTLGKADQLRLARGHPSTERTNGPSAHSPAVRRL